MAKEQFKLKNSIECLKEIKQSGQVKCDGDRYFYKGVWIGTLRGSVGPYGESSGIFIWCSTTTPINEMFGSIVNERKVPGYC